MPVAVNQKIIDIGRCIYCNISEGKLTDEHVIPLALGGTMLLSNASCEPCRDVTSRCERNPLNENWAEVRAYLDYPSRKRNFDEENFPLKVILKDGTETILNLKRRETLGIAQFLELDTPGCFKPKGTYTNGVTVVGVSTFRFGASDIVDFCKRFNVKNFSYSYEYKGNNFEMMIAKIAYCYVVAYWGLDCFEEKFVLPTVLRQRDDVGFWVGCDPDGKIVPLIGKQKLGNNALKIGIFQPTGFPDRLIIVRLKFFVGADTPEYIVVVGILKKDFEPF